MLYLTIGLSVFFIVVAIVGNLSDKSSKTDYAQRHQSYLEKKLREVSIDEIAHLGTAILYFDLDLGEEQIIEMSKHIPEELFDDIANVEELISFRNNNQEAILSSLRSMTREDQKKYHSSYWTRLHYIAPFSIQETVLRIQGNPDTTEIVQGNDVWYYGKSYIVFANNPDVGWLVVDWVNTDNNLIVARIP